MDLAPELQPGKQPSALARFWAEALDEFEIRAYDDDEIARFASIGRTPETDPCLIVDGPSLEICFQEIDVPPMAKRPMHLDVATPDRQTENARLVSLGASIVQELRHTRRCAIPKATTSV
jgi:hypothetical protein